VNHPPGRKRAAGSGRLGTVLVVDDEPAILRLLRLVLSSEGFAVLEGHGGRHALDLAARQDGPIHVLLTDVRLGDMTGQELARRLRLDRPALRVLYMTTDFPNEPVAPAGVHDFVSKPLGVTALVRRVRELSTEAAPAN
jgi:DNA-binding response OmpR family regulator